jgi:type IV pilus assembly protein PilM
MSQIGLDLGSHSIKCVELDIINKNPTLVNFAIYESDKLKLDFANEDSINLYISKIKEFFKETDFQSRDIHLSLPDTDVFVSVQVLPKMSATEIRNYINLQANDIFPENIANLTYDFKILGEKPDQKMEVLVVGAKKDRVEKFINLIKRCDLTPKMIEAKSISLARLVDKVDNQKPVMILDFGYNSSTLQISYKQTPRFIKSIAIGSNSFNKALIQNLNLSLIQADEYKKSYGMVPNVAEDRVFEYLKPLVDSFVLDIKRSIVYFTEKNKNIELSQIYLSGGLASMPGLAEYLQKNLNFKVEVFDIFSRIRVSSDLKKYENELFHVSPLLTTSIGSAGVGIL